MLFCSSPVFDLSFPAKASSPADPWWPTLSRAAVLRRFARELDADRSYLVDFVGNSITFATPLDSNDVALSLLGRRADASATSVGLIAAANDNPFSTCTVVDRPGPAATGFWNADGTLRAAGEASGMIVDLLLCVLGQATPPCAEPTTSFWLAHWFVASATHAADTDVPTVVSDLVEAHPATQLLGAPPEPTDVGCATGIIDLGHSIEWPQLISLVLENKFRSPLLSSSLARWFDGGSLGRWCLSGNFRFLPSAARQSLVLSLDAAIFLDGVVRHLGEPEQNQDPTPLARDELLP